MCCMSTWRLAAAADERVVCCGVSVVLVQRWTLLDVGVGSVSEGATEEESGVVFFGHVSSVRLVLQARVELHEDKHLVGGQQREVIWWVGYHIPLGRRVTRT